MTHPDRDRQKVYDAEDAALGGTIFDETLGWEDLTRLFVATTSHPWWSSLGVPTPLLQRARSDSYRSSANGKRIRIARGAETPVTLAHELSHHLAVHIGFDDPGHGAGFRACSLRVCEIVAGSQSRGFLHESLHRAGLEIAPWWRPEPPHGPGLAMALGADGEGETRRAIPLGPGDPQPPSTETLTSPPW